MGPSGALGDTWKYAQGNWTLLLTATAPSPRWGAAIDYDDSLSTVVLFGGRNSTTFFNDTWEFSGGIWTHETTPSAPSPRAFAAMTYNANSTNGYTVLYGGTNATTVFNDTWNFTASGWTKLNPSGAIPALKGSSFAFNRHSGYAILFGGIEQSGVYSALTYGYRGDAWTLIASAGPSARAFAGMAFDRAPSVKALILFGGCSGVGCTSYDGDTWMLSGNSWVELSASTPGLVARAGVALAFDGLHLDFYTVLWGGYNGAFETDTWNLTTTSGGWTEVTPGGSPPKLTGATLAIMPKNDYVVLFGGVSGVVYSNSTWLFNGGSWTRLCTACGPSPRAYAAATYSTTLNGVVLFGGNDGTAYYNDTWEFINGVWHNVTSGPAPSPRDEAGFAFNPAPVNESILFGGYNGTAYLNDTWEFNASGWAPVPTVLHPSARADAAVTYDGPDSYMLLFGGTNASAALNDTWAYRAITGWSKLTPAIAPPARFGARAAYDPFNGHVVLTGGSNYTSYFNDTWEFRGGTWTNFVPDLSPPVREDAALTYDRDDQYIVQFGGYNGATALSDTWLWVAFSAKATAAPNPTDVGVPVAFGVSAVAGVQPYSYLWTFGDGNTSTTAAPLHNYTTPGTYTAYVTVTDSRMPTSDQTVANVTPPIKVNPRLTVTASANQSAAIPGFPIAFNATRTGGTAPYTYTWLFGDGPTANTTENATHRYATIGTFNATVFVNDSAGASVNQSVTIRIVPNLAATVTVHPTSDLTDVGVPVSFNSTPIGGVSPYTYSWRFGDGQGNTSQNTTHAYLAAGTYTVRYWVNDSADHDFNTSLTITVAPLPSAKIVVQPTSVDLGVTVTFNGTVSNGTPPYTYLWTFGDGGSATTLDATHAYAAAGNFTVTFVATDSVGQTAQQTATVTVAAAPSVTATATPSDSEVGVAVAFSATATGGVSPLTYAWVFGDGGHATGATASHTYSSSGTFTATVWANDSFGVSAHGSASVTVNPRISSSATASPTATDAGVAVTFSGVAKGGVSPVTYAWSFGDGAKGTGAAPTHAYASAGTYHVVLWANDSLSVSAMAQTNVSVVADPSVSAFTVSSGSVTSGSSVTFSATVAGGTAPYSYAYTGLPAGCTTANQATLTCSPSATGTYMVHVTITDAFGLSANATVSLTVTSPSSSSVLGLSSTEWYILIAVIVIVIAALLAVWAMRRRRRGASGQSSAPTSDTGPSSPEPSGETAENPAPPSGTKSYT